nr:MAG TPA: hypothetical protein [Inoviridae sp.]
MNTFRCYITCIDSEMCSFVMYGIFIVIIQW